MVMIPFSLSHQDQTGPKNKSVQHWLPGKHGRHYRPIVSSELVTCRQLFGIVYGLSFDCTA